MKRIKCACLEQTIHFELKEDLDQASAAALVKKEVENYKLGLEKQQTKFRVDEESVLPDGSIQLKIRKQYNSYPCGAYLE